MNEQSPFEIYRDSILKKIDKKKVLIRNLQGDLKKFQNALLGEQDAELIRANFHLLKRGMKEISLMEYGDKVIERVITLDPLLSPQLFMEKLFNNLKKAKRGIKNVVERLEEEQLELLALEDNLRQILALGPEGFILPFVKKTTPKKEVKEKEHSRKPYRTYLSSDNIRILVGRSAKDSDELTLRHTRGNEWWFHARDVPGAHVVVKHSEILPEQTLREAAMLAAHFSKVKTGTTVQYTQVKFVKKPKNSPAGLVSISKEQTIDIVIDQKLLIKLLKTSGSK